MRTMYIFEKHKWSRVLINCSCTSICQYNVRVPTTLANKKNAKQIHYMVDQIFYRSDFDYFKRVKAEINCLVWPPYDDKSLLEFQGSISNSSMI